MSDFVQQQGAKYKFSSSDSWVILSPIEQSIKHKIEAIGIPLKKWNINIYRGVLTGFNEAFIISTEKRNEILGSCLSEEERNNTAELIRPILRGRDIKRYGYDWANLWIINTHNGIKGKFAKIDIEDYPSLKKHLDLYWDKISKRVDKGDTPYNLRNCAYLEDFFKPKIIWGEISDRSKFCLDLKGTFIPEATTFYLKGDCLEYLLSALNSSVSEWLFSRLGTTTGVGTVRWKKYTIEQLLVAKPTAQQKNTQLSVFTEFQKGKISLSEFKEFSNNLMYSIFGLDSKEIDFIENLYN